LNPVNYQMASILLWFRQLNS